MIFDLEKLVKVGKVYDLETVIPTKISPYSIKDSQQGDGGDGNEGSTEGMNLLIQSSDVKSVYNSLDNCEKSNDIAINTADTTIQKDSEQTTPSQEPSQLSLPSPSPMDISKSIYRLGHSDTLACKNCRLTADKWYMQQHQCRGSI